MKKISKRLSKREYLLLAITILLGIFFLLKAFPVHMHRSNLDTGIMNKQKAIVRNLMLIKGQSEIEKRSKEIAPYIKVSKNSDEKEITYALRKIESAARESGISLDALRPYGIEEENKYKKYSAEIECTTGINKLITFLYKLQSSSNLFGISRIQIAAQANQGVLKVGMLVSKVVFAE